MTRITQRSAGFAALGLVCLLAQFGVQAQEAPLASSRVQAAQSATAQGELVDVDARANTLTVKTAASDMKFTYNDQTKVTGAQKGVAGLATMAGSSVTVEYRKDGSTNIATSIEVRAPQAPR